MSRIKNILPRLLSCVERPGRYIGNEIFMQKKSWEDAVCRTCLVYPDTYEVGMPFLGFQILYHILNRSETLLAERCFSPWTDMEAALREAKVPLFSLETQRPLREFDIVGITLQYEMTYTNILNILDLAGIPLFSRERGEDDPLIIAGGSCAFNPEPLADFIDIFVIGDGEEILPFLCWELGSMKQAGKSRAEILAAMNLPERGVYVPTVYRREKDGPVKAAKVPELLLKNYPLRPLIPLSEITQDRFALEIQRGCGAGCRFCHAGIAYLPVRERDVEDLIRQTEETLNNSGYEELSLLSLSTSDYSALDELVRGIEPLSRENKVGISFPSLRLDSFNVQILEAAGSRRRSGLTFAPEAGTQRLRNAINKKISEDDLFSSVKLALEHGWRTLKFYFMMGLPTENDEDLQGIVDLIREVQHMAMAYPGTRINVSLSSFIPKAHTPFQWEAHVAPAELLRRITFIRERLRLKNVSLHYRDPKFSVYESLFSRGGREAGALLYAAWKNGARFDAWPELFDPEIWERAISESGIEIASEIAERPVDKVLPWSFIDSGVNEAYLLRERDKARKGEITEDCRTRCSACGLCDGTLKMRMAEKKHTGKNAKEKRQPSGAEEQGQEYYTLRIFFEKKGMLRYVGHHDLMRLMLRICNMLKWPLRYSSGFTKHPRIALGYPIPMGFDGLQEAMDILLNDRVESPAQALNALLPEGLRILRAEIRKGKQPSLMQSTRELCYRFHFDEALDIAAVRERVEKALAGDRVIMERKSGKRPGRIDLKPFIRYWSAEEQSLEVCYKVINSRTGRPDEFLQLAFDKKIPFYTGERKYVTIKE